MDEHAQGVVAQILTKVILLFEYLGENIEKEDVLPVLSVIGTVVFIVGVGYFMAYLVRLEDENLQKKQAKANGLNNNNNLGMCNTDVEKNKT